jgi:uncharacterized UPF0160 family protein
MLLFNKKKILVTHNGSFHTDDLFAMATLSILHNGDVKIIRTRDSNVIAKGDYVCDVGGIYDPETNRFDHHQKGGAGTRPNGIPYSSFGLVWNKYGEKICGGKEVADFIDKKIVQPIDAHDNGFDISVPHLDVFSYSAEQIFLANSPTWKENNNFSMDKIFQKEVKKIIPLLLREIEVAKADVEGKNLIIKAYTESKNKRVIILNNSFPRYLIQDTLPLFSEPIYFIYPSGHGDSWKVEAVRENLTTLRSRKLFPESWRGLMNEDSKLKELSGVSDIIFCHQSGFFLHVKTKEGAIALAQKALLA